MKRALFAVIAVAAGLVGTILAIAVAAEAVLALRFPDAEPLPLTRLASARSPYVYHLVPDRVARVWGVQTRFNNEGMRRDGNITRVPAAGVTRVLSYGDSIGFGVGVDTAQTYAARLEARLDGTAPGRWEVLNMARGYAPSLYAVFLREDLAALRPRLVLVEIELSNDVSDEALVEHDGVDADGLPRRIARARYVLGVGGALLSAVPVWGGTFVERTRSYAWLSRKVLTARERSGPNPDFGDGAHTYYYHFEHERPVLTPARLRRGFDQIFDVLAGMRARAVASGADFLVIVIPSRYAFQEGPLSRRGPRAGPRRDGAAAHARHRLRLYAGGPRREWRRGPVLRFLPPTARGYDVIAGRSSRRSEVVCE